jgi:hypothetical protein
LNNEQSQNISARLFLPGIGSLFFLLILGCFLFWRPLLLLGDGSACRHLDAGTYILLEHKIHTTNYTSALFPDVRAISASFLGDVLYALSYQLMQLNGLVLVAAVTIALTLTWCYQFARARGLGPVIGLLGMVFVMTAASMHWSARTLVFSHLIFLILFYVTFMAPFTDARRLVVTAVVMLFWVNFHGSFLLGMVMLGARLAGDFIDGAGLSRSEWISSLRWQLMTIAACAVVLCLSPNGPGFYTYVTGYLSHPMIMMKSNEWKSLDFSLGLQTWSFLALYALMVLLWAYSKKRPKMSEFILVNFLFFGGLYTMRLVPYFALAVLPAMALPWAAVADQLLRGGGTADDGEAGMLAAKWFAFEERIDKQERAGGLKPAISIGLGAVMALAFAFAPQCKVADFDPAKLPVSTTRYIIDNHLNGLGFCYDNWGGYLFWRLHRPIFIDDWTDFYPVSFTEEYVQAMMAQPGWQQVLDKYKLEYVLIPHGISLGQALANSPEWQIICNDPASELFVRKTAQPRQ